MAGAGEGNPCAPWPAGRGGCVRAALRCNMRSAWRAAGVAARRCQACAGPEPRGRRAPDALRHPGVGRARGMGGRGEGHRARPACRRPGGDGAAGLVARCRSAGPVRDAGALGRRWHHVAPAAADRARPGDSRVAGRREDRLDRGPEQFRETFARSASHAAQAQLLLDEVAAQDLALIGSPPAIKLLQQLSRVRQANALRLWLKRDQASSASAAQLEELLDQVAACTTRGHAIDIKVGHGFVQRAGGQLAFSRSV
jgi:hypothetical protein